MIDQIIKESSKIDFFQNQFATFNRKIQPTFSEVQIGHGMGFTFNLIDADKLFEIDE